MGRVALGAPGEQIQEGEEEVAGTTFDESDPELGGPPPQPEGLKSKGLDAALARFSGPRTCTVCLHRAAPSALPPGG